MNARPHSSQLCLARPRAGVAILTFALGLAALAPSSVLAVDYAEGAVVSELKAGLDKVAFADTFKSMSEAGFRIGDIESYRSGRSTSITTLWTKLGENERWAIELSLPFGDFIKAHQTNVEKGFSLVEFEVDRVGGATLHFSGVWSLAPNALATEFYYGLETLDFSNRYGEMADRGYRLIDFEAYESNGKFRNAGIWIKKDEGMEVRFYRGIPRASFGEYVTKMKEAGFRVLDVEGYVHEGNFVFAAQWVKRTPAQEADFAYDLLADEFYSKNGALLGQGYRLVEFEVYTERDTLYYAGSWLKVKTGAAAQAVEPADSKSKKPSSLEEFRSN